MNPHDITIGWLQQQTFSLQNIYRPPTIDGVVYKQLNPIPDGRGDLIELWSSAWPDSDKFIQPSHVYQSGTDYGVVKCWHLHAIHTDQMTVTRGKIQIVLADIRQDSSSFGHVNSIFMSTEKPGILVVPPGIMHGWKCLSQPEVLVINLQSHPYDPDDEIKFPFDSVLTDIWEPKNA